MALIAVKSQDIFREFERRQREAAKERKEKYLKQTRTFCFYHHDDILISVVGSSSPVSIVFRFLTSLRQLLI